MAPEYDKIISRMLNGIHDNAYRHLVFICGSVCSVGSPSSIPDVDEITKDLVLGSMLKVALNAESPDTRRSSLLRRLAQLEGDDRLRASVDGLAFEQFMSCLYQSNPAFASILINECAHAKLGSPPTNDNHRAVAVIAARLIEQKSIDHFTVITTNYDSCVEEAFKQTHFTLTPAPEWPNDLRSVIPAYRSDGGAVRVI